MHKSWLDNKRLLLLISLGAILEYYDFAIYIYLAPLIGKSLIEIANPRLNLAISYAVLAIGSICRPIGGIIFAHFGDRVGRSKIFICTILFMAIPTFFIGLIPNFNHIGIWAGIILLILRIIQGFAIGGEVPGSIVFGYEIAAKPHKAIYSAIVILGVNLGFILASIMSTILLSLHLGLAPWRIAFILGGIFGVFSYCLRKRIIETPEFMQYKTMVKSAIVPLKVLFLNYFQPFLQILSLVMFLAAVLAVFTFYLPSYLSTFYHYPLAQLMRFNSYSIFLFGIGSLIAGIFDQLFNRKFFLYFIPLLTLITIWLFNCYGTLSLNMICIVNLVLLLSIGIVCGRVPVLCANFFPVQVRYTGVAFVYNISFGIIAGTTQVFLTWLINLTNLYWMPALYISFFASIAMLGLWFIPPRKFVEYV